MLRGPEPRNAGLPVWHSGTDTGNWSDWDCQIVRNRPWYTTTSGNCYYPEFVTGPHESPNFERFSAESTASALPLAG